mgnify:CR=1 FL=1
MGATPHAAATLWAARTAANTEAMPASSPLSPSFPPPSSVPRTPTLLRPPQRVYRAFFTDSTRWERYRPRWGDIVISTPPKTGTTWTQRIVSVLVLQSTELPGRLMEISPWLDFALAPLRTSLATLERQRHRRFLKTHLPMDALPLYRGVSYLVVGRDPRDSAVSAHHHALGLGRAAGPPPDAADGDTAPWHPPVPEDPRAFWRAYFTRSAFPWEGDGWPYNSPTRHLRSWWEHQHEVDVLFVHFQDLLDDLSGQMRRISAFLDIPVDQTRWPELVAACRFATMKRQRRRMLAAHLEQTVPTFDFFHRGTNGRWRPWVGEAERWVFEAAVRPLPADLRAWLVRAP